MQVIYVRKMEVYLTAVFAGTFLGLLFTFFLYVVFHFGLGFKAWWMYHGSDGIKIVGFFIIIFVIITYFGGLG